MKLEILLIGQHPTLRVREGRAKRCQHILGPACVAASLMSSVYKDMINVELLNFYEDDDEDYITDVIRRFEPDYVGFSLFLLEPKKTLNIARNLCSINSIKCFAGGATAHEYGKFLLDSKQFQFVVVGEGETPTVNVFDRILSSKNFDDIPGIMTLINLNPKIEREDVSKLPSPWLMGLVDPNEDQEKVESFRIESSRGCIFSCSYCSVLKRVSEFPLEKIEKEIKYIVDMYPNADRIVVIDATITNNKERFLKLLDIFKSVAPQIQWRLTARPEHLLVDDKKNIEIIEKLSELNVLLAFGLQSVDLEVQRKCHRTPVSKQQISSLSKKLNEKNINFSIDLILGLPGETVNSFKDGIDFLLSNNISLVLAKLVLLHNSYLYDHKDELGLVCNQSNYVIQTPTFSKDDLQESFTWAINKINRSSIFGNRKQLAHSDVKGETNVIDQTSHYHQS